MLLYHFLASNRFISITAGLLSFDGEEVLNLCLDTREMPFSTH